MSRLSPRARAAIPFVLLAAAVPLLVLAGRQALEVPGHHAPAPFVYPWACPMSPRPAPCPDLEFALFIGGPGAGLIGAAVALGLRGPRAAIAGVWRRAAARADVMRSRTRYMPPRFLLAARNTILFTMGPLIPAAMAWRCLVLPWPYAGAFAFTAWLAFSWTALPCAVVMEPASPAPPPAGPIPPS